MPKNYDWGIVDAMSTLQGLSPSGQPEAELWFGSNPMARCTVDTDDENPDFPGWLEANGHQFPLLVKFLAASKPLSIQVHPDSGQAEAGFARENAAGLASDSSERMFKDRFSKPELIIALSENFDALWGLLPATLRAKRLERCAATGLATRTVEGLRELDDQGALQTVLTGDHRVDEWAAGLSSWSLMDSGADSAEGVLERDIFRQIAQAFPGDRGIVLAFLMHTLRLNRGEALFISPGQIHAYVGGFGLEVMLPSDNVVRGGLTSKHQDPDLFLEIATAPPMDMAPLVAPVGRNGPLVYEEPAMPFRVLGFTGDGSIPCALDSLILGEQGEFTVSRAGSSQVLRRGEVYFVAGDIEPLQLQGQGNAWLVEPRLD